MLTIPASAQTADAIYQRACGPKDVKFDVQQIKGQMTSAPEPGKARVFFILNAVDEPYTIIVGLDGKWVGAFKKDSYLFVSVAPGEHRACVNWQGSSKRDATLVHFIAKAGEVRYYLVRTIATGTGPAARDNMEFEPADRDEALYLIASDPQSIAMPKP